MKIIHARRVVAGLTLGAVASFGLAAIPTPAHAAVDEAFVVGANYVSSTCPAEGVEDGGYEKTWADDNVPVTGGVSSSGTASAGEEDVVDVAVSNSTTIRSTALGSGPATMTGSASASATALARQASTECDVLVEAQSHAQGLFTLTQPMWVTLTAKGSGHRQGAAGGSSWVGVASAGDFGPIFGGPGAIGGEGLVAATGNRGTTVASTLLPAGDYAVVFMAYASAEAEEEREGTVTYTGTFTVDFDTAGSASPAVGKGTSKVQFGDRDCASGNIPVVLAKKTVKKAKSAKVKVDGKKVAVLKGKKLAGKKPKAKTITVPTSATAVAKVKVKLVLKNGRRMQATRSYVPCR